MKLESTTRCLLISVLITSCATTPDVATVNGQLRESLPTQYTSALPLESSAPENWMLRYAPTELQTLIRRMLAQNFELAAMAGKLRNSQLDVRLASAQRLPSVDGQARAGRSQASGGNPADSISAQLSVAWELDLWRKLRDTEQASILTANASEAEFRALKMSLAASTLRNWFNAVESQQLVNIYTARLSNLSSNQENIESRYRQGIANALDVYLARNSLAQESARLLQQQQTLAERKRQIQVLVGDYPSGAMTLAGELPIELPSPPPPGVPADLLNARPDIRAAYFTLEAASKRVASAHKQRFPSFNLTGGAGYASNELSNLVSNNNLLWSLFAGLAQPLFNAGQLKTNAQQAEVSYGIQQQNYLSTIYNAFYEVESALQNEAILRERLATIKLAEESALRAESLAFEQYLAGLVEYTTVLEAQRRSLDNQIAAVQLRNQLLQNRIALHLALGGDFTMQETSKNSINGDHHEDL